MPVGFVHGELSEGTARLLGNKSAASRSSHMTFQLLIVEARVLSDQRNISAVFYQPIGSTLTMLSRYPVAYASTEDHIEECEK